MCALNEHGYNCTIIAARSRYRHPILSCVRKAATERNVPMNVEGEGDVKKKSVRLGQHKDGQFCEKWSVHFNYELRSSHQWIKYN